jgi:hypothetical protein
MDIVGPETHSSIWPAGTSGAQAETQYRDALRRFTPTPFGINLGVMGRTLRLETNSASVFRMFVTLFEPYKGLPRALPQFLWRIVSETGTGFIPPWPEMTAFSDDGLQYVNLGHRSFLAVDLEARTAIAFVPEAWVGEEPGFSSVFAATLFDLTVTALHLVQVSCACVARDGKALLIFGPPRSGKTTSAYLAGKLGLEFHADEATFLDASSERWVAWGQFWPAAFREDTAQFLPELVSCTRPFSYGSLTFLCFHQPPFRPRMALPVTPVGCVFLQRQAAEGPALTALEASDAEGRLHCSFPFRHEVRLETQISAAKRALAELPAYELAYWSDPAEAAAVFRTLLELEGKA